MEDKELTEKKPELDTELKRILKRFGDEWTDDVLDMDIVDIKQAFEEAGYFQEEAEWIGQLLDKGWIPPGEAKTYGTLIDMLNKICSPQAGGE